MAAGLKAGMVGPLRPGPAALLLALLLAAPTGLAASAPFSAASMAGEGVTATMGDAMVALWPSTSDMSLVLDAPEADLRLIDEQVRGQPTYPLDPAAPFPVIINEPGRDEERASLSGLSLEAALRAEDAIALVVPAGEYEVHATTGGSYAVSNVADHVVEDSHVIESSSEDTQSYTYYAYRSGDNLQLALSQGGEVVVAGDFDVYFWALDLSLDAGGQRREVRTGEWSTSNTTAGEGVLPQPLHASKDIHFAYAVLSVRGGSLRAILPEGQVQAFAADVVITPESAAFNGAQGALAVRDGTLETSGGVVRVTGGSYALARADDRFAVRTMEAPRLATGTHAQFVPAPTPWFLGPTGIFAGVALVVTGIALVVAYPSLVGRAQVRRQQALSPDPVALPWRQSRAEGYAALAARAEALGHPRRAAFWMRRALAAWPADPLRMVDAAILLAQANQAGRALRMHEAAHGWLVDAGSLDQVAHNAYEAARTAASLDRKAAALDWLRIALEAEPGQAVRVGKEPAFARLRDEPDYASLTMGGI